MPCLCCEWCLHRWFCSFPFCWYIPPSLLPSLSLPPSLSFLSPLLTATVLPRMDVLSASAAAQRNRRQQQNQQQQQDGRRRMQGMPPVPGGLFNPMMGPPPHMWPPHMVPPAPPVPPAAPVPPPNPTNPAEGENQTPGSPPAAEGEGEGTGVCVCVREREREGGREGEREHTEEELPYYQVMSLSSPHPQMLLRVERERLPLTRPHNLSYQHDLQPLEQPHRLIPSLCPASSPLPSQCHPPCLASNLHSVMTQ